MLKEGPDFQVEISGYSRCVSQDICIMRKYGLYIAHGHKISSTNCRDLWDYMKRGDVLNNLRNKKQYLLFTRYQLNILLHPQNECSG